MAGLGFVPSGGPRKEPISWLFHLQEAVCSPWLVVPHHSDLCSHHHFPDSPVSHVLPTRILVLCWAHPDNSAEPPHFKVLNLSTSAKSFLPNKATYSQILV